MTHAKINWNELPHEEKLQILQRSTRDALVTDYHVPGLSADDFAALLNAEYDLWNPLNLGPLESLARRPSRTSLSAPGEI